MNPILFFLKDLRKTGAVAPSSKYLARDVVRFLNRDTKNSAEPLNILELGPGTGTLTKGIVSLLRDEDNLDVVEINPHFTRMLRRKFKQDNISVHYADFLEFMPPCRYDFIFSSIPYETMPEAVINQIWNKKLELCKPGGKITYYKYLNFNQFKSKYEKELVKTLCIDERLVIRNLPPAKLYTLEVRSSSHVISHPAAEQSVTA